MAAEKAPAFQFYPKDFLTDSHVVAMTLAERGAYITLLCLCWMDHSIPADPCVLARLCAVSSAVFQRLWPALEPCFVVSNGRLVQPRIERERRKQHEYREMKAAAGHKGGRATAEAKQTRSRDAADGPAESSPPSSSSSSSSIFVSDLPSPKEKRLSPRKSAAHPATSAGDERFQRFWADYPNKKGKDAALRAWTKRHPSEALTELILGAIERQKRWPEWTKDGGAYIPHPATWLNGGHWDDEPNRRNGSGLSDTARHNLEASEEAGRLIEESEAHRGHQR